MKLYLRSKGNFNNAQKWLNRLRDKRYLNILDRYGARGVDALREATPKDTGITAESWGFEIHHSNSTTTLTWTNSNINEGVSIAIILQYGHGTGSGGYVEGTDYINPALAPIFDEMAEDLWKEVSRL